MSDKIPEKALRWLQPRPQHGHKDKEWEKSWIDLRFEEEKLKQASPSQASPTSSAFQFPAQDSSRNEPLHHLISECFGGYEPLVRALFRMTKAPLSLQNEVYILTDGPRAFPSMIAAISNAKHFIHLETYIFRFDRLGNHLADLLATKAEEGVQVRLLYDGLGSALLSTKRIHALRSRGVHVEIFAKLKFPFISRELNYRNHRKILIVDGKIGFLGGLNWSDEYASLDQPKPESLPEDFQPDSRPSSPASVEGDGFDLSHEFDSESEQEQMHEADSESIGTAAAPSCSFDAKQWKWEAFKDSMRVRFKPRAPYLYCRDTHLRITGQSVNHLHAVFLDDWQTATGERFVHSKMFFPSAEHSPSEKEEAANVPAAVPRPAFMSAGSKEFSPKIPSEALVDVGMHVTPIPKPKSRRRSTSLPRLPSLGLAPSEGSRRSSAVSVDSQSITTSSIFSDSSSGTELKRRATGGAPKCRIRRVASSTSLDSLARICAQAASEEAQDFKREDISKQKLLEECSPPIEPANQQQLFMPISIIAGDATTRHFHEMFFAAIVSAQKSIVLEMPYLVPNPSLIAALRHAAASGKEVTIVTQGRSDESPLAFFASHPIVRKLLASGVRVFRFKTGFFHKKVMIIDRKISLVGSANFDYRSFLLNYEVGALIWDENVARRLFRDFQEDLSHCFEVTLESLERRPLWRRAASIVSHIFSSLM